MNPHGGDKLQHPEFAKAVAQITADRVRDVLMDLVNIPSPTGKEGAVAHYLVDRMRDAGLDTDLQLVDEDRPNAVAHLRGQGNG